MGRYHQKKGKGKLPIFCGNGERVNPVYARHPAHFFPQSGGGKERGGCKLKGKGRSPRLNGRGVGPRRPPTRGRSHLFGRPEPWPPGFSGGWP